MSYLQYLSVVVDHNENSLHITSYVLKHIRGRNNNRIYGFIFAYFVIRQCTPVYI